VKGTTVNPTEKLAREVLDAFHHGQIERIGDLVTEDFVDHGAPPWAPPGRAAYVRIMRWLKDTLRVRYEIHEVVANGDYVAVRATVHGEHNATYTGFQPTGKPYAMSTMHMYRSEGGLLAEHWGVRDELGVLWQVGALPAPEPVAL
jgi:predicted ester cyclase